MAIKRENIDSDTYETAKMSIDHAKIKVAMPSNVNAEDMIKCQASTLVLAGEKDCLFPASRVIPCSERIIPHCMSYILKERGHMNFLTNDEEKLIVNFLLSEN